MLGDFINKLKNNRAFMNNVTHWEVIPERKGDYRDIPEEIDSRIKSALFNKGIKKLYAHQLKSYDAVRQGKNVVIVTPTASGKTLAYNLPVLQSLLKDRDAKAMYLFPTKALSQDQQAELNEIMLKGELPLKIFTYDGDTPSSIRISVREEGRLIITNPDMLHTGILPNHTKWIRVFKSLKFIVIDEIHTYRGVFGSHMANLLRRLKRIAGFYGSAPTFICCSATIGNPKELAENIIEEEAVLIDTNGSPSGTRHFVLYNPPLVDRIQGIRRGVVQESRRIASGLIREGIKTIVFARSRLRTELIASYINQSIKNFYTDNHRLNIAAYRGGYLPNERRRIESGLREGTIAGVVSTNALELGIDIGGLDASVMAGFPGTISSAWQQAGRAGRNNSLALSILIASASPIDQYIIQHPEYFFGKSPESGWVDPDNIYILLDHLKCAAFELPFKDGEAFNSNVDELLNYLEESGILRHTGQKWYWSDRSYPAESVSLRTSTPENIVIVNTASGKNEVIGEMDLSSAKFLLYKGAVYMHQGDQYIVQELDLENHRCYIEDSKENYYTDSIVKTDIKMLQQDEVIELGGIKCIAGDVLVRSQATKYKKLKYHTHENIGYGEINLPADEMHTRAVVLLFTEGSAAGKDFTDTEEALKAEFIRKLGTLLKNISPVFLLCDIGDIGIAERVKDPVFNIPALYVFDHYPGGTGISEGLLKNMRRIVQGAHELVSGCSCDNGCPSCIGPSDSGGNVKVMVIDFLGKWLNGWQDEKRDR
ncbi:MAG: DEAD/DEAH box helicase [Spirochaetes bacterium]|nr:DEAD/DEAH box helicase [Spirochaetota bacterium]